MRDEPAQKLVEAQGVEDTIENATETDAIEDVSQQSEDAIEYQADTRDDLEEGF